MGAGDVAAVSDMQSQRGGAHARTAPTPMNFDVVPSPIDAGRWLVVRLVAGLPPNGYLGVVEDCPNRAAAERMAAHLNQTGAAS